MLRISILTEEKTLFIHISILDYWISQDVGVKCKTSVYEAFFLKVFKHGKSQKILNNVLKNQTQKVKIKVNVGGYKGIYFKGNSSFLQKR